MKIIIFNEDVLNYGGQILNTIVEINPFIRHVFIYCKNKDKYLNMSSEGKVQQSSNRIAWDITVNVYDRTITLFSNGFYLKTDGNKVIGYKYMEKCYYKVINGDNNYYFYFKDKNNNLEYLSMEEAKEDVIVKIIEPGKNETFELMDTFDDDNINMKLSFCTEKIVDMASSYPISSSSKFS